MTKTYLFAFLGAIAGLAVAATFNVGDSPDAITVPGTLAVNGTFSLTNDVVLVRDAANTLAQRNGTNVQAFNLYGTYTDGANYNRLSVYKGTSWLGLKAEGAGTGSGSTDLKLQSDSYVWLGSLAASKWGVEASSGKFLPFADNSYDIGSSGNRPRSVYAATSILLGTNVLSFSGTNLTWNGVTVTVP